MATKDPINWMLSDAIETLARAERLHQQFLKLRPCVGAHEPCWEPPIDVLETDREVLILIALPGVDPNEVEAILDKGTLVVSGRRALPAELRNARIHRHSNYLRDSFERRVLCRWVAALAASPRSAASACASPNQRREAHVIGRRSRDVQPTCRLIAGSIGFDPRGALIIVAVRNTVIFRAWLPRSYWAVKAVPPPSRLCANSVRSAYSSSAPQAERTGTDDLYRIGTVANIIRYITGPDDSHHVICRGVQRPGCCFLPAPVPGSPRSQYSRPTTSSPEIRPVF